MRLLIILLVTIASTWSLHKHYFNRAIYRQESRIKPLVRNKVVFPAQTRTRKSFYQLFVIEHLASCSENEVIKEILGASSEYCLRENIDIIANFKGFSEQIFNIGFLIIAYFTIKRANNRGHRIREINDLLQDDELDDDDMNNNNPENNKKKRLPRCPQCSGTGKYMWKGESNVLDVCELCDGVGYIDFSTSTTTIQQLPNNLRNNNNKWIDEENNENM